MVYKSNVWTTKNFISYIQVFLEIIKWFIYFFYSKITLIVTQLHWKVNPNRDSYRNEIDGKHIYFLFNRIFNESLSKFKHVELIKNQIRYSYISIIHNKDTFHLRNAEPPYARHNSPYIEEFNTPLLLDSFRKRHREKCSVQLQNDTISHPRWRRGWNVEISEKPIRCG